MNAQIIARSENEITLAVKIKFNNSMIQSERFIQSALNDTGCVATEELLNRFDTDGTPIVFGNTKLTSKGKVSQKYQTPYGEVAVDRNVYQSSKGGKTFCPMEKNARIVLKSTPKFAEQVSHKAAEMASTQVAKDFDNNHQRHIPRSYIKKLSEAVASVAQIKEETWEYHVPENLEDIKTVSIGMDGTCLLYCNEGYREAMAGTISFYNSEGKRLHTVYIASEPEHGKNSFKEKMEQEIFRVKKHYPMASYIGLADGAPDNWSFLENHVDNQVLDFYHVTEYLSDIAPIVATEKSEQKTWLDEACHNLKHKRGAADRILNEITKWKDNERYKKYKKELDAAISYFTNHKSKMKYAKQVAQNMPIGSGVTEAACKVIVKQRLCKSGMKWKEKGAGFILSLRALSYSNGRWEQFWNKIDQYGF
jgi:hypothetical protein